VPSISTDSVDFLLDSFDSKIKSVIDDIAPVKMSGRIMVDKKHPGETQQQCKISKLVTCKKLAKYQNKTQNL